jgi:hypothetical protein
MKMEIICLIWTVLLLGGIVVILKKGFNELVKGMESLDSRLKRIEDKMNKISKHEHIQ